MINALVSCVPPILSSTVFLALFIFLGAVLGVQFFSGTRESIEGHATNVPAPGICSWCDFNCEMLQVCARVMAYIGGTTSTHAGRRSSY